MTLEDTVTTWNQSEIVRLLKGAPGTHYQEADNANKAIMRDWVRSLLQKGAITVTFVKADGSDREMLCTLNGDLVPVSIFPTYNVDGTIKESKQRKQPDEHSIRVFDLDKQEWRSFRFDRLKKVTAELNFG